MIKPLGAIRRDVPSAPPPVTFENLLVAVGKTRDRDAFIRLFEHFAPRVKSFLMKGGFQGDLADELAQETMLTVWDRARLYNPERAAASTWIYTIARNKRVDALRKQPRPTVGLEDSPAAEMDATPLPDTLLHHAQEAAALTEAIDTLPPEQAELIQKAFFEEQTHSAIAEATGLPLGTVKSRIRLALDHIRKTMAGDQRERAV